MKSMKNGMKIVALSLVLGLAVPAVVPQVQSGSRVEAATTVKLNKTKLELEKGTKYNLKLNGTSKKVTWSSSNQKIATVTSKGKVTAKKAGSAKIYAKAGGKTYTCKLTVTPTMSEKVNALNKYMKKKGKKDSSGNYYLQKKVKNSSLGVETVSRITYNASTKKYEFYTKVKNGSEVMETKMALKLKTATKVSVTMVYTNKSSAKKVCTLKRTFTRKKMCFDYASIGSWKLVGTLPTIQASLGDETYTMTKKDVQLIAEMAGALSVTMYDEILKDAVDMDMVDFGFLKCESIS